MILNQAAKIWIYGFGIRGQEIEKRLGQETIKICGFVDQKPEQYADIKEVQILSPYDVLPTVDTIVICAVSNVFEHEKIAEQLSEYGFRYIVFKSFKQNNASRMLNRLYDDLTSLTAMPAVLEREIPCYQETCVTEAVLETSDGTVCVNVPVELLFGLTRELLERSLVNKDKFLLENIPEKSILYYTLPKKMMAFFAGQINEKEWERSRNIWFECRNAQTFASPATGNFNEENQNQNIKSRYAIFQRMQKMLSENPMFFRENPIWVLWNPKGFFHIQDGNNRAAFLLAKGIYYLPCRMTEQDFESWRGRDEKVKNVDNVLHSFKMSVRSPIVHPMFDRVSCELDFYSHKKVAELCDWMWDKQIQPEMLNVCEYYCSNDLCGSQLARMEGFLTVIDSKEHIIFHKALDDLYQLRQVQYCEEIPEECRFDMVISNNEDLLKKNKCRVLKARWYVLEFVDVEDEDINTLIDETVKGSFFYLMRQLVGNKIYKVVIVEGEN